MYTLVCPFSIMNLNKIDIDYISYVKSQSSTYVNIYIIIFSCSSKKNYICD